MNKKEFTNFIAEKNCVSNFMANSMLETVLDAISEALTNGDSVKIQGFGSFEVVQRSERVGRNPHQPEKEIIVPAYKSIKFKVGKQLKEAVNK